MNKKGFTLIELLAVVVILLLLVLLVGLGTTRILKKAKTDIADAEKNAILAAAENWAADNIFELGDNECTVKSVNSLVEDGYLDSFEDNKFESLNINTTSVRVCSNYNATSNTYNYTYTLVENN